MIIIIIIFLLKNNSYGDAYETIKLNDGSKKITKLDQDLSG